MLRVLSLGLLACLAPAGCRSPAAPPHPEGGLVQDNLHVPEPPPPRRRAVQVKGHKSGKAWIAGHYTWRGGRYVWIAGTWVKPPRPNVLWLPGRWRRTPDGSVWASGRWIDSLPDGSGESGES